MVRPGVPLGIPTRPVPISAAQPMVRTQPMQKIMQPQMGLPMAIPVQPFRQPVMPLQQVRLVQVGTGRGRTLIQQGSMIVGSPQTIVHHAASASVVQHQDISTKPVTLYIGHLTSKVKNEFFQTMLNYCGQVKSWKRVTSSFGFVEFMNPDGALRALRILVNRPLFNKKILVNADKKTQDILNDYEKGIESGRFQVPIPEEDKAAAVGKTPKKIMEDQDAVATTLINNLVNDLSNDDSEDEDRSKERDRSRSRYRRSRSRSRHKRRRRSRSRSSRRSRSREERERRERREERRKEREARKQKEREEEEKQRAKEKEEKEKRAEERAAAAEKEKSKKDEDGSGSKSRDASREKSRSSSEKRSKRRHKRSRSHKSKKSKKRKRDKEKRRRSRSRDEDEEPKKKRKTEDKGEKEPKEEKKPTTTKDLVELIPKDKKKLLAYDIDWDLVDKNDLVEKIMRKWIDARIQEYLGEEEADLTNFAVGLLAHHIAPKDIIEEMSMVLVEDAEGFVVKMWRRLIFESLKKKHGIE